MQDRVREAHVRAAGDKGDALHGLRVDTGDRPHARVGGVSGGDVTLSESCAEAAAVQVDTRLSVKAADALFESLLPKCARARRGRVIAFLTRVYGRYTDRNRFAFLAIQFAFIAMFSTLFPLWPTICCIMNAVRVAAAACAAGAGAAPLIRARAKVLLRADAYRLCFTSRRPFPRKVRSVRGVARRCGRSALCCGACFACRHRRKGSASGRASCASRHTSRWPSTLPSSVCPRPRSISTSAARPSCVRAAQTCIRAIASFFRIFSLSSFFL